MSHKTDESNPKAVKPPIIWLNLLVFLVTFLVAIIGVPIYAYHEGFSLGIIMSAIISLSFCELSITAGYHRLWSHKAYEANVVVRFFYALGGAFAVQNSALHWCSDHRIHHTHVDNNDIDPYSANRGFWYSHIGWMLREYQAHRYDNYENVKDLKKDKIVMWQHKYYLTLVLLTNFGIPLLIGWYFNEILASMLVVGVLRLVLSHHLTFCINSLAHMWGSQPYNKQNTAKDNPLVALLTFGEGYHNFHHAFQYDYRNAIKWWQFDPTKWLIKGLSIVGLAKNLKKIPEIKITRTIVTQQYQSIKTKLIELSHPDKEQIMESIQHEYDLMINKMTEYYNLKRKLLEIKKEQLVENIEKSQLTKKYQELKESWELQQKQWQTILVQYA